MGEQLRDPLDVALVGMTEQEIIATLIGVYSGLQASGLVTDPDGAAPGADAASAALGVPVAPKGRSAQPMLSVKRFEAIFSKELKKRERAAGPHAVTAEAMACCHDWDPPVSAESCAKSATSRRKTAPTPASSIVACNFAASVGGSGRSELEAS